MSTKTIIILFIVAAVVLVIAAVPVIKIKTSIDDKTGVVTYGKETILKRIMNTIGGYKYL